MKARGALETLLRRVLISDRRLYSTEEFGQDIAAQASRFEATAVLLREKDLDTRELSALALDLRDHIHVPLLIAHDEAAAATAGADGVHLGWSSSSIAQARNQLRPGQIVGVSVHSVDEGRRAASQGADYLMLGAIQPTIKAHGPYPVLGFEALAELCLSVECPVIAVGGMNPQHEEHVKSLGAAGWAAIRAFSISGNDL